MSSCPYRLYRYRIEHENGIKRIDTRAKTIYDGRVCLSPATFATGHRFSGRRDGTKEPVVYLDPHLVRKSI